MQAKNFVKSALLKLFDEGKSEVEAYDEFFKIHSDYNITKKAVKNWYEKFRSGDRNLEVKNAASTITKFTDEDLVKLIKENPDYSVEKLSRLSVTPVGTIRSMIKRLEGSNKPTNYSKKDKSKFTDEFLIDLVNKNPHLNMRELAKLAGTVRSTISVRIKQINSNGQRVNYVYKNYNRGVFPESIPKPADEDIINLINENPKLTIRELGELAGVSENTFSKWIKQIKQSGKTVNYVKKNTTLFADEFLIGLINENPSSNLEELGRIADTSSSVISHRLAQINSNGEKVKYTNKKPMPIVNARISNECLIELISENPDLGLKELSQLAGITTSCISKRIKKINSSGIKLAYVDKRFQKEVKK